MKSLINSQWQRRQSESGDGEAGPSSESRVRSRHAYQSSLSNGERRYGNEADAPRYTHSKDSRSTDSTFRIGNVIENDYVDSWADGDGKKKNDDAKEEEEEYDAHKQRDRIIELTNAINLKRRGERTAAIDDESASGKEEGVDKGKAVANTNVTSSELRRIERSYFSLSIPWKRATTTTVRKRGGDPRINDYDDDDDDDDGFQHLNVQEIGEMQERNVYIELETYLGSVNVQRNMSTYYGNGDDDDDDDDNDSPSSATTTASLHVSEIIKYMKLKGHPFIIESKGTRSGDRAHVYYRLEDDGSVVIVANIETHEYVGRFYAPKVTDDVSMDAQKKNRTKR